MWSFAIGGRAAGLLQGGKVAQSWVTLPMLLPMLSLLLLLPLSKSFLLVLLLLQLLLLLLCCCSFCC